MWSAAGARGYRVLNAAAAPPSSFVVDAGGAARDAVVVEATCAPDPQPAVASATATNAVAASKRPGHLMTEAVGISLVVGSYPAPRAARTLGCGRLVNAVVSGIR